MQQQVRKVAKLARLDLTEAEIEEFTGQLGAILEYVEKMNELDTADSRAPGALPADPQRLSGGRSARVAGDREDPGQRTRSGMGLSSRFPRSLKTVPRSFEQIDRMSGDCSDEKRQIGVFGGDGRGGVVVCRAGAWRRREKSGNGGQSEQMFQKEITKKVSLGYLLYLPKGYGEKKEQKWPLILFLHGAGRAGQRPQPGQEAWSAEADRPGQGVPVHRRFAAVPDRVAGGRSRSMRSSPCSTRSSRSTRWTPTACT